MTSSFNFDNSYATLPGQFYARQHPTPVRAPRLITLNEALAEVLSLRVEDLRSPEGVGVLAGNSIPDGADPIAMAYAGHQFGNWVPQLGDGRAVLLGEIVGTDNQRYDLQLKGAGPTPFSRNGDGRAGVGPVLREFVLSEAMHALGVPTTRALAAVSTGENVIREQHTPGAVLTRVASSHVRVGTFQYFVARRDLDALKKLTSHVVTRHYPELEDATNPALALLKAVSSKQAQLIAHWQSIGFIHGVMNTDNSSIAGITIDYGPCAFMDAYSADAVFSSIDYASRYAYKNQPGIAQWNLANLAQSLLPLIDEDENKALTLAQDAVDHFNTEFSDAYLDRFRKKLGLHTQQDTDPKLISDLLDIMSNNQADFTLTFRALCNDIDHDFIQQFAQADEALSWLESWRARRAADANDASAPDNSQSELMRNANPAYIPRNHRIEEMIQAAYLQDYEPLNKLMSVLSQPYSEQAGFEHYAQAPTEDQRVKATFCGT
jgi:uncharacterized protein YdiU (UPF0061 family)